MKLAELKISIYYNDFIVSNKVGGLYILNKEKKSWAPLMQNKFFDSNGCKTLEQKIKDNSFVRNILSPNIQIKIKSCDLSSKVHGFRSYKESLLGTKTNKYTYEGIEDKPKKGYLGHTFMIFSKEKNGYIKFCEEDLEFCIPDFDNYTMPKDRSFKNGSIVKPKSEKHIRGYRNLVSNEKYSVCRIITSCPYNKKPIVVEIIDRSMNTYKIRTKHFKVI